MTYRESEMPPAERAAHANGYRQGYCQGYREGYQDAIKEFNAQRSPHDANQDPKDKA